MKIEHFQNLKTKFDLSKVTGGATVECTFRACYTDTNDPDYECGDTHYYGKNDDGEVYMDEIRAKKCIPT